MGRFKTILGYDFPVSHLKINFDDGLLIIEGITKNDKPLIRLTTTDYYLLRVMDEGSRLVLQRELSDNSGLSGRVFEDTKSDLIIWAMKESLDIGSNENLRHYIFFFGEEVLDLVMLRSISAKDFIISN